MGSKVFVLICFSFLFSIQSFGKLNNQEILQKRLKLLDNASILLKKEFIGLDDEIDQLVDAVRPWILHREAMKQPLIIGIWGLTGTGKTSMVMKLSTLLNQLDVLAEMDFMPDGDFAISRIVETQKKRVKAVQWYLVDNFHRSGAFNSSLFPKMLTEGIVRTERGIFDFRKSVFFLVGNLPGEYQESFREVDADSLSADFLNMVSKAINVIDVKDSLTKSLFTDQIARLGQTHIIFKTPSAETFRIVLERELDNYAHIVQRDLGLAVQFTPKFIQKLETEAIVPSQGIHPIYSAVQHYVYGIVPKTIAQSPKNVETLIFDIGVDGNLLVQGYEGRGIEQEPVFEQVEKIKWRLNPLKNNLHQGSLGLVTAVHEAGHAVLAIAALQMIPSTTRSKTMRPGAGGLTRIPPPATKNKKYFERFIQYYLGGYVAEEIRFGKQGVSDAAGSGNDLERATGIAYLMVSELGMGSHIAVTTKEMGGADREEVNAIVQKALKKTKKILRQQKRLHKAITEVLLKKSEINREEMRELILKHFKAPRNILEHFKTKDALVELLGNCSEALN